MAISRAQMQLLPAHEALEELARASVVAKQLPAHLRDELAALRADSEKKLGFDKWFETDPAIKALRPAPRLCALLAGLQRYTAKV